MKDVFLWFSVAQFSEDSNSTVVFRQSNQSTPVPSGTKGLEPSWGAPGRICLLEKNSHTALVLLWCRGLSPLLMGLQPHRRANPELRGSAHPALTGAKKQKQRMERVLLLDFVRAARGT